MFSINEKREQSCARYNLQIAIPYLHKARYFQYHLYLASRTSSLSKLSGESDLLLFPSMPASAWKTIATLGCKTDSQT